MLACDRILHHPFMERAEFLYTTGWTADLYDEFMALTPTRQMNLVKSWKAQDDANFETTLRKGRTKALKKLMTIMDDPTVSLTQQAYIAQFVVRTSATTLTPTEVPSQETRNLDYERIRQDEQSKEEERVSIRHVKVTS